MIRWLSSPLRSGSKPAPEACLPSSGPHRFTVEEIDRLLLGLPELERAVYLNHRLRGRSYARMARRLGVSIGNVEHIIARAIFLLIQAAADAERAAR